VFLRFKIDYIIHARNYTYPCLLSNNEYCCSIVEHYTSTLYSVQWIISFSLFIVARTKCMSLLGVRSFCQYFAITDEIIFRPSRHLFSNCDLNNQRSSLVELSSTAVRTLVSSELSVRWEMSNVSDPRDLGFIRLTLLLYGIWVKKFNRVGHAILLFACLHCVNTYVYNTYIIYDRYGLWPYRNVLSSSLWIKKPILTWNWIRFSFSTTIHLLLLLLLLYIFYKTYWNIFLKY